MPSCVTFFNHCCVSCAAVKARAQTHKHHIFYRKRTHTIYFTGEETAQNIPMRTYTPQSSTTNTACNVCAHHLLQSLLRFLCSCAKAKHMQMSGHGLPCCAPINDSRKVEYTHRQYSLQNTLNRNCNLCNERQRALPALPPSPGTCAMSMTRTRCRRPRSTNVPAMQLSPARL